MTRIIAGLAKGHRLDVPAAGTRPTSDRVRESIFSSVEHAVGGFDGRSVLDLYAGSGAVGLEAMSRGARRAVLVESATKAVGVIRSNIARTGLDAEVVKADVTRWVAGPATAQFDVVFADPPYSLSSKLVSNVVSSLSVGGWLADGAVVVVERDSHDDEIEWATGFSDITRRRFGNTSVLRAVWYVANGSEGD